MSISADDVLHVARLARLDVREDEVEKMAGQLAGILAHAAELQKLDLTDVPPTAHAVEQVNVTRPDEPRPSWPRDDVLGESPEQQDGMFRVPPTS
jgi:aspartyl-tRNA(Asn)/glutamyl-tRNA(Gln) amidotransferase subunit C